MCHTIGSAGQRALGRLVGLAVVLAIGMSVGPTPVHGASGSATTGAQTSAASGPISELKVVGSPFYPNGDGVRERVKVVVRLSSAARLSVEILDFDGALVKRRLAATQRTAGKHVVYWKGRNLSGARVADGPYVVRATATTDADRWTAEAIFTKAVKPIFKPQPGQIVVAIDPGHGDVYSEGGRTAPDGSHEKQYNLDIGLRLQKMLEGAGVGTVISRTTDQGANTPEWDRNGDGLIEYADELAARCDMANLGRADVFISIHNNLATNTRVGGPATYYRPDRPFGSHSQRLAHAVQNNMLARLDLYRTDTWKPSRSHGVLTGQNYYVLAAYSPPRLVRPTLMPGVLSEGMFLTHPYELSLLKQPRVRQSMAAAYYDAVQQFIAGREFGARYTPLTDPGGRGPVVGAAGSPLAYRLRLVNNGMAMAAGWKLEARLVPAVLLYDGSSQPGELVGSAAVPSLARGGSAELALEIAAPAAGDWLVKLDVLLPDGRHLSDLGIPVLQLPLSIAPN